MHIVLMKSAGVIHLLGLSCSRNQSGEALNGSRPPEGSRRYTQTGRELIVLESSSTQA